MSPHKLVDQFQTRDSEEIRSIEGKFLIDEIVLCYGLRRFYCLAEICLLTEVMNLRVILSADTVDGFIKNVDERLNKIASHTGSDSVAKGGFILDGEKIAQSR